MHWEKCNDVCFIKDPLFCVPSIESSSIQQTHHGLMYLPKKGLTFGAILELHSCNANLQWFAWGVGCTQCYHNIFGNQELDCKLGITVHQETIEFSFGPYPILTNSTIPINTSLLISNSIFLFQITYLFKKCTIVRFIKKDSFVDLYIKEGRPIVLFVMSKSP